MLVQPGQQLVLPATLDCPFPPTLTMSMGALSTSAPAHLLWFPASNLGALAECVSTFSAKESQLIWDRLRGGAQPSGDVPALGLSGDEPYAVTRVDSWTALQRAGFDKLPVIATPEAQRWLVQHVRAEPLLPEGWRVQAGPL